MLVLSRSSISSSLWKNKAFGWLYLLRPQNDLFLPVLLCIFIQKFLLLFSFLFLHFFALYTKKKIVVFFTLLPPFKHAQMRKGDRDTNQSLVLLLLLLLFYPVLLFVGLFHVVIIDKTIYFCCRILLIFQASCLFRCVSVRLFIFINSQCVMHK